MKAETFLFLTMVLFRVALGMSGVFLARIIWILQSIPVMSEGGYFEQVLWYLPLIVITSASLGVTTHVLMMCKRPDPKGDGFSDPTSPSGLFPSWEMSKVRISAGITVFAILSLLSAPFFLTGVVTIFLWFLWTTISLGNIQDFRELFYRGPFVTKSNIKRLALLLKEAWIPKI